MENVRSFSGRFSIPLRRLTFLVGENSTGKSTFLAMFAHTSQLGFPTLRPLFSVPPFDLGTYDSIATSNKRGQAARANSFSVGYSNSHNGTESRVLATYSSYRGQPQLSRFKVNKDSSEVSLEVDAATLRGRLRINSPTIHSDYELDLKQMRSIDADVSVTSIIQNFIFDVGFRSETPTEKRPNVEEIMNLLYEARGARSPVFALAPVRTKPRRTYDEISDKFMPEGDHIPVLLARAWQSKEDTNRLTLMHGLNEFGRESSLFRNIRVKRLGAKPSDPFQILVAAGGPAANLPDVGYGVSQALPVVVQSLLAERERTLLLQQPEVHLHPRGQAALGSFFARLVAKERKAFVIETHSDYLLDRIRLEIASGNLSPSDVMILFFEKKVAQTKVSRILIDDGGNIVDAPRSYRKFFLDEELTLMSRANK